MAHSYKLRAKMIALEDKQLMRSDHPLNSEIQFTFFWKNSGSHELVNLIIADINFDSSRQSSRLIQGIPVVLYTSVCISGVMYWLEDELLNSLFSSRFLEWSAVSCSRF